MFPGPSFGCEVCDLPVGGGGQSGEDVAEVCVRIESATTAAFDDGVQDGAAFPGLRFADEQPVFLSQRGGADGVFDQVVVDLRGSQTQILDLYLLETRRRIGRFLRFEV